MTEPTIQPVDKLIEDMLDLNRRIRCVDRGDRDRGRRQATPGRSTPSTGSTWRRKTRPVGSANSSRRGTMRRSRAISSHTSRPCARPRRISSSGSRRSGKRPPSRDDLRELVYYRRFEGRTLADVAKAYERADDDDVLTSLGGGRSGRPVALVSFGA